MSDQQVHWGSLFEFLAPSSTEIPPNMIQLKSYHTFAESDKGSLLRKKNSTRAASESSTTKPAIYKPSAYDLLKNRADVSFDSASEYRYPSRRKRLHMMPGERITSNKYHRLKAIENTLLLSLCASVMDDGTRNESQDTSVMESKLGSAMKNKYSHINSRVSTL